MNTLLLLASIYSYQCTGNFLEGEGVTAQQIQCLPHQNLALLKAKYTYFLFEASGENNFPDKGADKNYSNSICGLELTRIHCSNAKPELQFKIPREPHGIFQIPVILSPNYRGISRRYGYAAAPKNGVCAEGLVPAEIFIAQPSSIANSSFENRRGWLDDRALAAAAPPPFQIFREASQTPCDADGNCREASFREPKLIQSVPYESPASAAKTLCVFPK